MAKVTEKKKRFSCTFVRPTVNIWQWLCREMAIKMQHNCAHRSFSFLVLLPLPALLLHIHTCARVRRWWWWFIFIFQHIYELNTHGIHSKCQQCRMHADDCWLALEKYNSLNEFICLDNIFRLFVRLFVCFFCSFLFFVLFFFENEYYIRQRE